MFFESKDLNFLRNLIKISQQNLIEKWSIPIELHTNINEPITEKMVY